MKDALLEVGHYAVGYPGIPLASLLARVLPMGNGSEGSSIRFWLLAYVCGVLVWAGAIAGLIWVAPHVRIVWVP